MSQKRYHIILDARCDKSKHLLSNRTAIAKIIQKIAQLCEMRILFGPIVVEGSACNPGLSAFAIIDFSHISIHTFTATSEISVDIFSCKPFDYMRLVDFVISSFSLQETEVHLGIPVLHLFSSIKNLRINKSGIKSIINLKKRNINYTNFFPPH